MLASLARMWKAILASLLGISKKLAVILAPIVAGALAELLTKTAEKAVAFVRSAAADPALLSGEARHAWVTEQIKPLVKDTATEYLPQVRDAVINLGVKSAYDTAKEKGLL